MANFEIEIEIGYGRKKGIYVFRAGARLHSSIFINQCEWQIKCVYSVEWYVYFTYLLPFRNSIHHNIKNEIIWCRLSYNRDQHIISISYLYKYVVHSFVTFVCDSVANKSIHLHYMNKKKWEKTIKSIHTIECMYFIRFICSTHEILQ